MSTIKSKALCDKPRKNIFCGQDKYLSLKKLKVRERMFPVMEDDSYFIMIRSGTGRFTINGVTFAVGSGNVCWIQCTHVLTIEPDPDQVLELWSCVYDYQLSNYLMFRLATQREKKAVVYGIPMIGPDGARLERIRALFEELDSINKKRDYGSALVKVSLLGQIAVLFGYEVESTHQHVDSEEWPLAWRASMYIAAHSGETLEASDVMRVMGTDVATLNRELRMSLGMNFEQLLNRCRCIMGASYFLYENLPFDYIAVHSGFKSEVTFYRNFKKTMGMTPREYREYMMCDGSRGVYRGMIMDETLVSVVSYLYNNISEQVSLDSMAKALFTSGSIIRSLLDQTFGIGYKDVLSLFRIRYSESLLSATELPVVDVSVMVGFNSDRTFSRVFSEINGQSPSEYRRMCREKRSI